MLLARNVLEMTLVNCMSHSDKEKMKAWVEHYARLLNVEFEWESDLPPEVAPVEGPPPQVTKDLIRKALRKMKCAKAAGPSGIIAEMLKAAGVVGIELLTELIEVVFCNGVIPTDWQESFILSLYKGKGDALERGYYCGLKLTDQVMKLLKRVLDSFIREMVDINAIQLMALCRVVPYKVVKPGHLLCQTCSGFAGTSDQWSAGSAESEMMTKCPRTHSVQC